MSSRLLATVVAGLLLVATPASVVSVLRPRVDAAVDLLCVLIGQPVNNFTRVPAPIQVQDGRMRPEAVPISVTYGPGFAAYPQAQAAFQYAVEIWQTQVTSAVTVTVQADFSVLASGVLGSAGFKYLSRDFAGAPMANTWFPGPIANSIVGYGTAPPPAVIASFNSAASWYFGTDGMTPFNKSDFVSVVLHELGHGLGFLDSINITSGLGIYGFGTPSYPLVFDRNVVNGSNQAITNTGLFPNNSAALAAQLTSGNIYWSGGHGVAGNGGLKPRLYAPATWSSGSSISHLDDAAFPAGNANSLMTHAIGLAEAIHDPGPIVRGIFKDSGWALDVGCTYALSATAFPIGQAGGTGTVGVTAGKGCAWTATSNDAFITITGGASGTGSGIVTYSAAANAGAVRSGTITIAGQTFTLSQGPLVTTNRAALAFGATNAAGTLTNITAPQTVALTFAGASPAWSATTTTPWLQVGGGAGSGNGQFTVSVVSAAGLPATGTVSGTVTLSAPGVANSPKTLAVTLTLFANTTTSATPFGSFDTPAAGASVAGSIAVTGWALDDIEVSRVEIWRDKVAGETTPGYAGGGLGSGKVFIANAFFVAGARPDVETAYATAPLAYRAGWGYLLLTQGLWNQGNGWYTLHAFAYDKDGHGASLGSKAITVNNATATLPFGGIDVPGYGETMSGGFWNFGWALTPNAAANCTIGASGVQVSIDSGPLQPVGYGAVRDDIAAAFPGATNGAGAGGAYYVDSTTLSNGTHSIGWFVTDNCNRAEGIGSRFFDVLNAASTVPLAARPTTTAADAVRHAIDQPVMVWRGLEAVPIEATADGDHVVTLRQEERIEVELPAAGGASYAGYQVVNGTRRALPAGSSLDGATGVFYWHPATGFLGTFELQFVPASGGVVRVQVVVAPPEP